MSARVLVLVCVGLAACSDPRVRAVGEDVSVSPPTLTIRAWEGHSATVALQVGNRSRAPADGWVEASAGLVAPASVRLPGGATEDVLVEAKGRPPGTYAEQVRVGFAGDETAIPVLVEVRALPDCEPHEPCLEGRFDVERESCTMSPRADGAPCSNACLLNGICSAGACKGEWVSCDDGNACTLDFCTPDSGCDHTDDSARCSTEDPCKVGVCDPASGCATVNARDGTFCGEVRCGLAEVCIDGACVEGPAPPGWDSVTLCASDVEAGRTFTCALLVDGRVACWGKVSYATDEASVPEAPTIVSLPGRADRLWVGDYVACGKIQATGEVFCWGIITEPMVTYIGQDLLVPMSRPVRVPPFENRRTLNFVVGSYCASDFDGGFDCVGIGPNLGIHYDYGLEHVSVISAESQFNYRVALEDGSVWGWVAPRIPPHCQDEKGFDWMSWDPEMVLGPGPRVLQIASDCALRENGRVTCWGNNTYGRVRFPPENQSCYMGPVEFGALDAIQQLTSYGRWDGPCVIQAGAIYCWGIDFYQSPTEWSTELPLQRIGTLDDVVDVAMGGYTRPHMCGVRQDHTVFCTGSNQFGAVGIDPPRSADGGLRFDPYLATIRDLVEVRWDGRYNPVHVHRNDGGI